MQSIPSILRRARRAGFVIIGSIAGGGCAHPGLRTNAGEAQAMPRVEEDGTIHVPPFDLPASSFLSGETRVALRQQRAFHKEAAAKSKACPPMKGADRAAMPPIRQCEAEMFYTTSLYRAMRDRYAVTMTPQEIGGVYTEVFTPTEGIAQKNAERVLINVHGGAFVGGARTLSHLESIPIASIGKIKVVSIDYRMAPEYTFPAASEDVAAVYRELLKIYTPENIGLYGCSAGGALTAHAIAWFQKEHLPPPGAIGMFCMGASRAPADSGQREWFRGDAASIVSTLFGYDRFEPLPYYQGVDRHTPLASPGDYDEVMAKFPPSLLISGIRDFALSSIVVTHAQLVRLGVEAALHIWEGMEHAFHFNPAFPESREAYAVIVKFFDTHLGT